MISNPGSGYACREYALSFGEWGEVLSLPESGGHLLLRPIPASLHRDATGCYPIFSCQWSKLSNDLSHLPADLISVSLVADPFSALTVGELRQMFRIVHPLHNHYVVDLTNPCCLSPSRHHQRKLRQAARGINIAIVNDPPTLLDEWLELYHRLSQKHGIRGLRRFTSTIFAKQLHVPGTVVFSACLGNHLIGADWYFIDEERVFAHLSAYSQEGYDHSVSYPMMAAAIEHFRTRLSVLDLGGTPVVSASQPSGLRRFKAGWATHSLPSYLCGIDLRADDYLHLTGGRPPSEGEFFPYYRKDEY
jgi:hypothetical protein